MSRRTQALGARLSMVVVVGLVCMSTAGAGSIVPADAKLEKLFERSAPLQGGLTEGPAVAPDGSIFFSDIAVGPENDSAKGGGGMILRFDPRTRKTSVFKNDSDKSNGLMFDAAGGLVACEGSDDGGRRVVRYDIETGEKKVLAERFEGKRFNAPNDLAIDRSGRIYFTDPRYLGSETRELEHRAVYRIDRDGKVVEVTHDVTKPNGIALSPDERTLYVVDHDNGTDRIDDTKPPPEHGPMKFHAFSLGPDGLVQGPRRTLIDHGKDVGNDGITCDVDGNVYLSLRTPKRPGILIVDPTGKEIDFIATGKPQPGVTKPVGIPSNCVFGRGYESDVLYITVDTSLQRVRLNARGYHLPTRQQEEHLRLFHEELVKVTPGEGSFPAGFRMGRDGGPETEKPARAVRLDGSFRMARYEVPQNLWESVMGFNPSLWKGPRNSVEMLTFDDAVLFCREATFLLRTLGRITSKEEIRLPTEAEWEYCARAGTKSVYSFGDDVGELGGFAWFKGNAAGNDPPVGAKKPNAWKLYDIHGYLWEWCSDPWHETYAGAPANASGWTSGGDAGKRVLRSGSWKDQAVKLTSTFRRGAERGLRDDAVGLRCVLAAVR